MESGEHKGKIILAAEADLTDCADGACGARPAIADSCVGKFAMLNTHQSVFILLRSYFAEMSLASADTALIDTVFGN